MSSKHTPRKSRTATTARPADSADSADGKSQLAWKLDDTKLTRLIALAQQEVVEFFHTPDGDAYATVREDGHKEHLAIRSRPFADWLARRFYQTQREGIGSDVIKSAANVLVAEARYDGFEHPVFIRIAERNGAIYLDLANVEREAVKITAKSWRIIGDPPVRFVRPKGTRPLPCPASGGSMTDLFKFLNLNTADDRTVFIGWLVGSMRPRGPYPVLEVQGPQGSGKSTLMRIARNLIDPNTAPIRGEPRGSRDLMIAAHNGWCLAFDNLSDIPRWLSDALCRLSTGGGFATRTLFTNLEEVLIDAQRPVMLSGIEPLAIRGDLLDRTVILDLPPISPRDRQTEDDFWRDFEEARPTILGALLDAVSAALRNLPHVQLRRRARMADFESWVTAAEDALEWEEGTFRRAYAANRRMAQLHVVETDEVAVLVREIAQEQDEWVGTATELFTELASRMRPRSFRLPQTPAQLSGRLRRLAPDLKAVRVDVQFFREGRTGTRRISIRKIGKCRQHCQHRRPRGVSLAPGDAPDA